MPNPRIRSARAKEKLSITMDADLYDWIAARAGPGKEFSSISHAIERGVASLRDQESSRSRKSNK